MEIDKTSENYRKSWYQDLFILTIIFSIAFFSTLGARPLMAPSEARYIEIPREMAESGDFITPRLNYVKYFEKPPLHYWLQAITFKTLGYSEWTMRFITALFALLGCLIIYSSGRLLFDRVTGWLSSFILASSLMYFITGQISVLDTTVAVLITGSLLTFICALRYPIDSNKRRYLLWSMYIFAALATLTKGLIGFVLPGLVIGLWILITNQWRLLLSVYLFSGALIFLAITVPWHILVQLQNPEFAHFYFLDQHFYRYATLGAERYQPFWWFIPVTLIGFYPWIIYFIGSLGNWWKKNNTYSFLLLWIVAIVIFFSFSKSKLLPYTLPVLPAMALLTGYYIANLAKHRTLLLISGLLMAISLLSSIGLFVFGDGLILSSSPTTAKQIFVIATLLLTAGCVVAFYMCWRNNRQGTVLTQSIAHLIAFALLFNFGYAHLDNRTIKPLAHKLKPLATEDTEVFSYQYYYQDLPTYLEKRVTVVDYFNELKFGKLQEEETADWMIDDALFWERWRSDELKFMVINSTRLQALQTEHPDTTFYIIAQTMNDSLVSNQPL